MAGHFNWRRLLCVIRFGHAVTLVSDGHGTWRRYCRTCGPKPRPMTDDEYWQFVKNNLEGFAG